MKNGRLKQEECLHAVYVTRAATEDRSSVIMWKRTLMDLFISAIFVTKLLGPKTVFKVIFLSYTSKDDSQQYVFVVFKILIQNYSSEGVHYGNPESLYSEVLNDFEKAFQCNVCSKIAKRKDNILAHIESHLPSVPKTCNYCGKLFKTKNSLTSHVSRWHRLDK